MKCAKGPMNCEEIPHSKDAVCSLHMELKIGESSFCGLKWNGKFYEEFLGGGDVIAK